MSAQDFLVELGTEELPPKALNTLAEAFLAGIEKGLQSAGLNFSAKKTWYTHESIMVNLAELFAFLGQGLLLVLPTMIHRESRHTHKPELSTGTVYCGCSQSCSRYSLPYKNHALVSAPYRARALRQS